MALQMITTAEKLEICRTINSYSTLFNWMTDDPFYIDEEEPNTNYLPSTSSSLGFAVIPMFLENGFIAHLKSRYGGNANIMSFINTQASLAEEKGNELEIEWSLRFYKEKKLFKTVYSVQSNLMPNSGNTGITLGMYEGRLASGPLHDMFSEIR